MGWLAMLVVWKCREAVDARGLTKDEEAAGMIARGAIRVEIARRAKEDMLGSLNR